MRTRAIAAVLLLVFAGVTAGLVWYLYSQSPSRTAGEIAGSGTIEATEQELGSQLAAQVNEVHVSEGDTVKAGTVLVILDDRLLREQVAAAQAGVDAAQASVEDAEDGTKAEQALAAAQLKEARANLTIAETQLSFAKIAAPSEGVVLSVPVSVGEVVSPGETVAVVGKLNPARLKIYVSEPELGRVSIGSRATVNVDAFPRKDFTGRVSQIASQAEFTPQNIQTREQRTSLVYGVTLLVDNPDGSLKPGMPADAVIENGR